MPFDRPIQLVRSKIIQHTGKTHIYQAAQPGNQTFFTNSKNQTYDTINPYFDTLDADESSTTTFLPTLSNAFTDASRGAIRLAQFQGQKPHRVEDFRPELYNPNYTYFTEERKIYDPGQVYWRPITYAIGSGDYQYMDIMPVTTVGRFLLKDFALQLLPVTGIEIPIGTELSLAEPPYSFLGSITRVERFGFYDVNHIDSAGEYHEDQARDYYTNIFFPHRQIAYDEPLPLVINYPTGRTLEDGFIFTTDAYKYGEGFRISYAGGKIPPVEVTDIVSPGFGVDETRYVDYDYITQHQTELKLLAKDSPFGTWAELLDEGWDQTTGQRFGGDTDTTDLPDDSGAQTVSRETTYARKRTYKMPYFNEIRPDCYIIDNNEQWKVTDVSEDVDAGRKKYNVVEAEILQD